MDKGSLVLAFFLISIISITSVSAEDIDQKLNAFHTSIQVLREQHKIPGLAVAIIQDHNLLWSKGYGFDEEDKVIDITPERPFWIASVTKTFIGLLFLQLESEGEIDLNDRINDVPGWPDLCGWLASSGLPFGNDLRCKEPITIQNILNHTANGRPGTKFFYNPILYSRLSRCIEYKFGGSVEKVEGHHNKMAQLVETKIFKPAGMNRTMASQWQPEKCLVFFHMAQGFGIKNGSFVKRPRPNRELAGGAGIVSTAEDLARYDIAMDTGLLGSTEIMTKLFTPAKNINGNTLPYAFGWYVQHYRDQLTGILVGMRKRDFQLFISRCRNGNYHWFFLRMGRGFGGTIHWMLLRLKSLRLQLHL